MHACTESSAVDLDVYTYFMTIIAYFIFLSHHMSLLAGCCEHGNEPSDPINGRKFPDQLSDYLLLKENSLITICLLNRHSLHLFSTFLFIIWSEFSIMFAGFTCFTGYCK